jgi:iron complex outermembrane recepter protein
LPYIICAIYIRKRGRKTNLIKNSQERRGMTMNPNILRVSLLLWLALFLAAPAALGQEAGAGSGQGVFDLGEVVVTGAAETVTQVTTVETVDRAQLDLTNSTDVSKALETLPGVFISIGSRNEAYLNVRGFNQRYVPIFYDGIPLYIPWDGSVDPSQLSTGNISQITLTKGAASTLYGPNTMGGVINIVSMKPQNPFEGSYSVEWNENGPIGSLNLGSKMERFYVMAGLSGYDFDDYKMSDDFKPITDPLGFRGYFEDGGRRDNSDSQSFSGNFKAGFMPADGHEYAVGVQQTKSERGLPPNIYPTERQRFWRFTDWEKTTYYFIGESRITDDFSARTRLYYDTYYNLLDSYDDATYTTQERPAAFQSTYDDYTPGASLVLRSTHIPRNTLSFAFHYKKDVHREQDDRDEPWERYEAETYSYGLEDNIKITENLDFVLGVNYDVQKAKYADGGPLRDDDDTFNGLGGLVYRFQDSTKVHASVARKTRFPTLRELYSSLMGAVIPNPNLKKEESVNYELGVERPLPWNSHAGIAFFHSDVEDLIERTRVGALDFYDNIGESRFQGFELSLRTEVLPRNLLEAHYTYLDAENRSPDRTSDNIREAPKHQFYLSDLFTVNEMFSLFTRVNYISGQMDQRTLPDRSLEWIELDSYWTVDFKAMVKMANWATFELGVRNAFDENYETSYGFPREGRTFFVGLRGTF